MEIPEHEDAPPAANRAVKLPPFWTTNPRAWLTSAEGAFRLRNIADEESGFFNCLHALPETTVSLIADLVEADPLPSSFGCASADRHPEGGTALQPSASGGPEAVGAVSRNAASLSQGPEGEQRLLQLLVSQQVAQGAPHPSIGGRDGGQAGVGRQG